jgi:hypothetical protein
MEVGTEERTKKARSNDLAFFGVPLTAKHNARSTANEAQRPSVANCEAQTPVSS